MNFVCVCFHCSFHCANCLLSLLTLNPDLLHLHCTPDNTALNYDHVNIPNLNWKNKERHKIN